MHRLWHSEAHPVGLGPALQCPFLPTFCLASCCCTQHTLALHVLLLALRKHILFKRNADSEVGLLAFDWLIVLPHMIWTCFPTKLKSPFRLKGSPEKQDLGGKAWSRLWNRMLMCGLLNCVWVDGELLVWILCPLSETHLKTWEDFDLNEILA